MATQKPGDRVPVRISRNGTQSTVTVTLGSLTQLTARHRRGLIGIAGWQLPAETVFTG